MLIFNLAKYNKTGYRYFSNVIKNSKEISINGITENIYIKNNFPKTFVDDVLENKTITTLGYGPQAMSQSLNLRDNGYNVILGIRKSDNPKRSWMKAIQDKWIPDKNLFEIDEL